MVSLMVQVCYHVDFRTSITITLQVTMVTVLILPILKLKTTNMGWSILQ